MVLSFFRFVTFGGFGFGLVLVFELLLKFLLLMTLVLLLAGIIYPFYELDANYLLLDFDSFFYICSVMTKIWPIQVYN